MYFDRDSYQKSVRRAREERWRVRGRARVVHPKYGAVVVPNRSNYSALLNAAEYLQDRLMEQTERVLARAARRK